MIIDCCYRNGFLELWIKRNGRIRREKKKYNPFFYMYLPEKWLYGDMIENLEQNYRLEECRFRTIYGWLDGFRVHAGRKIARAIEEQTNFSAELYNVDIRYEQRFMAENSIFPCGSNGESRFSPYFNADLEVMGVEIRENPYLGKEIRSIELHHERKERLEGDENQVLSDFFSLIGACDPDVILFPYADIWMKVILEKSRKYGLEVSITRSGRFRKLSGKSYWSYGRAGYRNEAFLPDGRILIDTENSFTYREGGLKGILLLARLTGLIPNLTSRFTPGTLISSYEVYEAIRRGIAAPFRKGDGEKLRNFIELRAVDKGGMIFQPEPGVYEKVHQLDFTSLYPSIIVRYNLSPETVNGEKKEGFLAEVLRPLLELRIKTKRLKKSCPEYSGPDSVLKWLLITCFGYTGYRNAKFGRIEVHEKITSIAREILLKSRKIAEDMGFHVIHGIVDCLWLGGRDIAKLKERIEKETGMLTEVESYDWIIFLPMLDGMGSYNRYYGRLSDGRIKVRGIMARRRDTPEYTRKMQIEMLGVMRNAGTAGELKNLEEKVRKIYERYRRNLRYADPGELAIRRRIGKLNYSRRCPEASVIKAYGKLGVRVFPGMEVGYVVVDSKRWVVEPEWTAESFDHGYYQMILERAWKEFEFVFRHSGPVSRSFRPEC